MSNSNTKEITIFHYEGEIVYFWNNQWYTKGQLQDYLGNLKLLSQQGLQNGFDNFSNEYS